MRTIAADDGRALVGHNNWVVAIAFSPDGKKLASLDRGGFLLLWAREQGARMTWTRSADATTLAWTPSGELLLSDGNDLTRRDGVTLEVRARTRSVKPARMSIGGDGRWILADATVRDVETLESLARASAEDAPFVNWKHGASDPAGDTVLLCDDGGLDDDGQFGHSPLRGAYLTLFDVDLRTLRRRRVMDDGRVLATAFDRATGRFVFATDKGDIVAWSRDGTTEDTLARALHVHALFCFGDASAALVREKFEDARLLWWSGCFEGTPTEIALPLTHLVTASEDGRFFAWVNASNEIRLLDLRDLRLPRKIVRTPPVSLAHLRALDVAWPEDVEVARACTRDETSGRIDLDATLACLESSLAYVARTVVEIHGFARHHGASVDDVSDQREELGERRVALDGAIASLKRVRDAVRDHVAHAPLPDVDEREPADPMAPLRAAVLARPDDLEARLAFAHALPQDDVHRQLIEAQCGALGLPEWSARRKVLEMRALSLAYRHAKKLTFRVAALCKSAYLERGFVEKLAVDADAFIRDAAAAYALEPIRALVLEELVGDLATSAVLAPIRELRCTRVRMDGLVASEHLAGLEELWVDDKDSTYYEHAPWFAIAATSGALLSLERLSLWNANGAAHGLRELARATALPALQSLWVYGGRELDAETLAELAASPLARRLRKLRLTLDSDDAARAFASGAFASLEELEIDGAYGRVQLGALGALDAPQLRKLDASSFACDAAALESLAARDLSKLRELKLYLPELDKGGLAALAEASWLPGLESLELRLHASEKVAARDLRALLGRLGPALRQLTLTPKSAQGLRKVLLRSPALEHLVACTLEVDGDLSAVLAGAKRLEMFTLPAGRGAEGERELRAASFEAISNAPGTFVRTRPLAETR